MLGNAIRQYVQEGFTTPSSSRYAPIQSSVIGGIHKGFLPHIFVGIDYLVLSILVLCLISMSCIRVKTARQMMVMVMVCYKMV